MQTLITLTDLIVTGEDIHFPDMYETRKTARAVVTDSSGKVALLRMVNGGYHKLPGGGVEEGENLFQTLERELLEEIGCRARVDGEIGISEEWRARVPVHQVSYCYLATLVGDKGEPEFTDEELDDGAQTLWVNSIDDAIDLLQKDQPVDWKGQFIVKRDLLFLYRAKLLALPSPE